jgi:exopolysaccharide biosynthesis polyprenyl glycosylphosphotransferase
MKKLEMFFMAIKVPLDMVALFFAAFFAFSIRQLESIEAIKPVIFQLSVNQFLLLSIVPIGIWILLFAFMGMYRPDPNRKLSKDVSGILFASFANLGVVAIYLLFTLQQFDSRFLILMTFVFGIIFVFIGRILLKGMKSILYRNGIGLRNVIFVGEKKVLHDLYNTLDSEPRFGYRVVKCFESYTKKEQDFLEKNTQIEEIIFAKTKDNDEQALALIEYCNEHHIIFKYLADLFSTYSTQISVNPLAGVPVIELKKTKLEGWWNIIKRLFDIVCSICLIIIFSPLLLLVAIIIFFETGTPIIYKNKRVGKQGRTFFVYKFRSMYKEDSTGEQFGESGEKALQKEQKLIKKQNTRKGPIYKISNDPRVTRFGRFIRKWSIDEIPNFFNVLCGTMSIVGPRPHQPREVLKYQRGHKKVLFIKPGITGLSQISGRSDLDYEEEIKLDILYIEQWTLLLDIIIFIKTPFIIFKKRKVE